MQVVDDHDPTADAHNSPKRHSAPEPPLHQRKLRRPPIWIPKFRLSLKTKNVRVRDRPGRKRGLTVISRRMIGSLAQLLEFNPENIVHSQLLRDLSGNISIQGSAAVPVG